MGAVEDRGLTRSRADSRDRSRRRVTAVTTAAGVVAIAATGGVMVALAPASSGAAAPVEVPTRGVDQGAGPQAAAQQSQQRPVATSGGS